MSRNHQIDVSLSDDTQLCITYNFSPGGFTDSEDEVEIISITSYPNHEPYQLTAAEEEQVLMEIGDNEANSQPDADWRNEW